MRGIPFVARTVLLCALASVWCARESCSATLYYWIDAQGIKHWSDRPAPGSTAVESRSAQGFQPSAQPTARRVDPQDSAAQPPAIYSSLDVLEPLPDSLHTATAGTVECTAQLTPTLATGHSVWFELDGARYDAHGAMALRLPAPRGTHVLRVLVLSPDGQLQIESAPVTFHIRQASIAEPPVGPALRKPR